MTSKRSNCKDRSWRSKGILSHPCRGRLRHGCGTRATDPVIAGRAQDGTIVEVFEWAVGGVEQAYTNPVVMKLWERYAAACDIVPLTSLAEAATMFASFTPLVL